MDNTTSTQATEYQISCNKKTGWANHAGAKPHLMPAAIPSPVISRSIYNNKKSEQYRLQLVILQWNQKEPLPIVDSPCETTTFYFSRSDKNNTSAVIKSRAIHTVWLKNMGAIGLKMMAIPIIPHIQLFSCSLPYTEAENIAVPQTKNLSSWKKKYGQTGIMATNKATAAIRARSIR